MNLKKKAIEGVVVAGSLVMMSAIAETADRAAVEVAVVAEEGTENAAAGRTAGVFAQLDQATANTSDGIWEMPASVEKSGVVMVTAAEEPQTEASPQDIVLQPQAGVMAELQKETESEPENTSIQLQAGATADLQPGTEEVQDTVPQLQAGATADLQPGTEEAQDTVPQLQAGAVAELQPEISVPNETVSQTDADGELSQNTAAQTDADGELSQNTAAQSDGALSQDTAAQTGADVQMSQDMVPQTGEDGEVLQDTAAGAVTQEDVVWQTRLMADVQEFLYVREAGDENASVVGKLYKGDVAEIVEQGESWTHVVSGNVDGYVLNSYCLFGADAMNYAKETFDTKAEIMTNGLRVRRSADTEGAVIAAVSTGTFLTVDTDAATVDGWVAVSYGGETGYVSAEYVTTELALGEAITIEEERAAAAKAAEEAAAAKAAQVSSPGTVQNAPAAATVDDVTLLAALIQCEAGNESYEGQLAVGAVVMNRVRSGAYPGSVHDVIYQSGQFTPAGRGSVANVAAGGPKASCIQAAQEALNGMDNTGGAVRFQRASGGHAGVVIGNHVFF